MFDSKLSLLECQNVPALFDAVRERFAHVLYFDSHFAQLFRNAVGICARLHPHAAIQHALDLGLQAFFSGKKPCRGAPDNQRIGKTGPRSLPIPSFW
jgi:hypothetical protein